MQKKQAYGQTAERGRATCCPGSRSTRASRRHWADLVLARPAVSSVAQLVVAAGTRRRIYLARNGAGVGLAGDGNGGSMLANVYFFTTESRAKIGGM